jgi:hypothetical protein
MVPQVPTWCHRCQHGATGVNTGPNLYKERKEPQIRISLNRMPLSIDCLPSELLETIFLRVVTPKSDLKLVAQVLACVAQVSKEWRSTLRYSCWHRLLRIRLQKDVSCTASEAIWLLQYLRGERGCSISATKAKYLFKIRDSDLAQLPVLSSRFLIVDVLEFAMKKYGSVSEFQERVWKCLDRARKGARTKFNKGVARQEAADNALKGFSCGVKRMLNLDVSRFVTRNRGTLSSIVKRASDLQWRRDDLTTILESEGLTWEDTHWLGHDAISYEMGSISRGDLLDKIARQVALKEALAAKGITTVPDDYSGDCRSYVRSGGDLAWLVDRIEINSFYLRCLAPISADPKYKDQALLQYMSSVTKETVLKEVPHSLQSTNDFHALFVRVFCQNTERYICFLC